MRIGCCLTCAAAWRRSLSTDKRAPGRPRLPDSERLSAVIPPQRVRPDQREKFDALGGAEWLRKAIDRAKVTPPPQ